MEKQIDYLDELKTMIAKAKQDIGSFTSIIDAAIAKGAKGSKFATMEYLTTLNDLAKAYSTYDLDGNLGQLINFFTVAETVTSVKKGIAYEEIISHEYETKNEQYGMEYAEVLYKETSPSNYPHRNDFEKEKLNVLDKQQSLSDMHKAAVSECQRMIIPTELLQRKTSQPFMDNDGNSYSCILEYVNHTMGLGNNLKQETHVSPSPKR
jgi:hypothetical protein